MRTLSEQVAVKPFHKIKAALILLASSAVMICGLGSIFG